MATKFTRIDVDKSESVMHHITKLGMTGRDRITGFEGVIESVSFDLYGCIIFNIKPVGLNKEGMTKDGLWFDVNRIEIKSDKLAMNQPEFNMGYVAEGNKGAAPRHDRKA